MAIEVIKMPTCPLPIAIDCLGISSTVIILDEIIIVVIDAKDFVQGIRRVSSNISRRVIVLQPTDEILSYIAVCFSKWVMDERGWLKSLLEQMGVPLWNEIWKYIEFSVGIGKREHIVGWMPRKIERILIVVSGLNEYIVT